ncbi:RNase adapter RapZ [Emcibacter sp. SYSU 3D8]|uniref:RNase adapter RapZ n=1 Tax=Emcibacter sp. SYSU 3D8 TaxID=3133969 RepID=UPI0031FF26EA
MSAEPARTRIVLVTGLSGAGRSSALKALEDLGYEAVDNVPFSLVPNLVQPAGNDPADADIGAVAVGIDCRTRLFSAERLERLMATLRARDDLEATLIFLDASDRVLNSRFTETRRRHPMAMDQPVQEGIDQERAMLAPVRQFADVLVDTSDLSSHDLRRIIRKQFDLETPHGIAITVTSFSFPRGLPRDADTVLDVRFLRNPHYVPELRPLSGRDAGVADYIRQDAEFEGFFTRMSDLILGLLPSYAREGKAYLTIAFGCTGGRHRSVFIAECLSSLLRDKGFGVTTVHRDADVEFSGSSPSRRQDSD